MRILIVIILMLLYALAHGQTHTMPGANVVPSGASLTINSGGSITAAAGSTVTGFGAGGGGNVSNSGTPTAGQKALWTDATHIQGVTDNALQWDGGSTSLVAATGRTSLGGTTVGQSFFTLANPGAVSFPEISAGNAVSAVSAATMRTDLAVQPLDSDLTLWAAITPGTNVGTFLATPSSANLRGALTDENGTGAALFDSATTPTFTTPKILTSIKDTNGNNILLITPTTSAVNNLEIVNDSSTFPGLRSVGTGTNIDLYLGPKGTGAVTVGTNLVVQGGTVNAATGYNIGGAAASGKILQGNGTNYVASTPTWPTTAGTAAYTVRSDGTNFGSYPQDMLNSSIISQATFATSDVYIANSNVTVAAGDFKQKGQYHCVFDMAKGAFGTGAIVITLRIGTLGTTGDPAILTFTFGAGTAVADTGVFDVWVNWRSVGSGTSAVVQGVCKAVHDLATTGLISNAASFVVIGSPSPSSGFNSSTATQMGLSFNGSTGFAGTGTLVQATLVQ